MHGLNEHRFVIRASSQFKSNFQYTIKVDLFLKDFFLIIVYSGRYNDFAKQLNANGYKVYGMDWIGKS
jgi:hypothetical protein